LEHEGEVLDELAKQFDLLGHAVLMALILNRFGFLLD